MLKPVSQSCLFCWVLACTPETNTKAFNYNPTVRLLSPAASQSAMTIGEVFDFEAEVDDANHDVSKLEISWRINDELVCDWANPTEGKISQCQVMIEATMKTVSVVVRDPQGAAAQLHRELPIIDQAT